MDLILDDLAAKSRVLYDEKKFKEVEEMLTTYIKETGVLSGFYFGERFLM
jgi:hypothetical protein